MNKKQKTRLVISLLPIFIAVMLLYFYVTRPVKIGIIISTRTSIGHEENLAIRFYRDRFPGIGLRKTEYIIYNPPIDKNEISQAYKKLNDAGVSIIIGGGISTEGIILAEESQKNRIPTFGINPTTHFISDRKDRFFRTVISSHYQGKYLARVIEKEGISRLAILTDMDNKSYADAYSSSVTGFFKGKSRSFAYTRTGSMWIDLHSFNPQGILMILPAESMSEAIIEVKRKNPSVIFISSLWDFDRLASTFNTPEINGVLSLHIRGITSEKNDPIVKKFEAEYTITSDFAMLVFSIMDIVYEGIKYAGAERDALIKYFEEPRYYNDGYGSLYMNQYGDSFPNHLFLKEIKDGRIVLRERIALEEFAGKRD